MKQTQDDKEQTFDISELPMSAIVKVIRPSKYGSVPDLDDEELIDPEELERLVFIEDYALLLLFVHSEKDHWINLH